MRMTLEPLQVLLVDDHVLFRAMIFVSATWQF